MENRIELPAISIQYIGHTARQASIQEGVALSLTQLIKARKQVNIRTRLLLNHLLPQTVPALQLHKSHFETSIQPLTSNNKETEFTANLYNPDVDERENHQMKGTVTDLTTNPEENPPTYDTSSASHSTTQLVQLILILKLTEQNTIKRSKS